MVYETGLRNAPVGELRKLESKCILTLPNIIYHIIHRAVHKMGCFFRIIGKNNRYNNLIIWKYKQSIRLIYSVEKKNQLKPDMNIIIILCYLRGS